MVLTPELKLEHKDARGEIYSIDLPNGHELMLLRSVAGSLRGGHSHTCGEIVTVLSGKMRYHKIVHGKPMTQTLKRGDLSFNPAGQIHMGEFLEESWVTEYKFAKKGDWSQEVYEPFRSQVTASVC